MLNWKNNHEYIRILWIKLNTESPMINFLNFLHKIVFFHVLRDNTNKKKKCPMVKEYQKEDISVQMLFTFYLSVRVFEKLTMRKLILPIHGHIKSLHFFFWFVSSPPQLNLIPKYLIF